MAVSKVLHGAGSNVRVSEARAELIRKIAKEMHYQANDVARSLRSRKTMTIAVVFQHFTNFSDDNPYYPQLLNGVMSALFPAEYTLALCPKLIQNSLTPAIADGRFDGVLWARPDFTETSLEAFRDSNFPLVLMHAPPEFVDGIPTFCVDNKVGFQRAVDHLFELGHTNIAFLIDTINENTLEGRARSQAFAAAMDFHSLKPAVVVHDMVEEMLVENRASRDPYTAYIAYSDYYAGQLLRACAKLEISVPGELSVIGFDSSSYCDTLKPRLTSLRQPVQQMAFEATNHLLSLVKSGERRVAESPAQSFILDCVLDVRESTARPNPN